MTIYIYMSLFAIFLREGESATPGVDRMFVMCKHVFYNETWIDTEHGIVKPVNKTGSSPEEYTTYVQVHSNVNLFYDSNEYYNS